MGNFPGEIQGKIPISHSMAPLLGDPLLFPSEISVACSIPVGCGADFSPVLRGIGTAETFGRPTSIAARGSPAPASWCAWTRGGGGHRTFRSWAVTAGTFHLQGHPGALRFCSPVPLPPRPLQISSARSVCAVRTEST